MPGLRVADLASRAVLHVAGADSVSFLDRIVTTDVDRLVADGGAGYGALLSPQGKILTDFLLIRVDDGFLIDCPRSQAADLLKRLTLYRLRAKLLIDDATARYAVLTIWNTEAAPPVAGLCVRDPRLAALGWRAYLPKADVPALGLPIEPEASFHAHRTSLGIPESGMDFGFGEAFPHEIGMDELSGVAFDKGCYVGQEVVSRMEHRGTARRRPVILTAEENLPETGADVTAGARTAGTLGSVAGRQAIAIVRLDRVRTAMDGGEPVLAGGVPVVATLPPWAGYGWPNSVDTAE